jgi:hypothetical protein
MTPPSPRAPLIIACTLWVYRRLLVLHPAAFRRMYGADIVQVLRATCWQAYRQASAVGVMRLWPGALLDLVRGALAEHAELLFSSAKGSPIMVAYRRSAGAVFAAYIAFVLAGIGFAKMSEEVMKSSLPTAHPILAVAYWAVAVGAMVSVLAVVVGGVPLAFAALRYAWANGRRDILARFAVPPLALLVIIAAASIVLHFNIGGNTEATIHTPARILAIGGLVALFIAGAAASVWAVLDAIARSEVAAPLVRFTFVPGVVTLVAMVGMLLASLVWAIGLWQVAPDRFWGNEGVLATSTVLAISVQTVLMLAASVVAARAVAHEVTLGRDPASLA